MEIADCSPPAAASRTPPAALDPFTFTIVTNRLVSVVEEMTAGLERAAMTPILALCHDYSCCLCDASGRLVAAGDGIPIHTGSMHLVMREIIEAFGETIGPGDVVACNDPYRGNTHIGDLVTACPVFDGERLLFWAVARGHQLDVGAPLPASAAPWAENVWQEGLTLPPILLYQAGVPRADVIGLYLRNVRWPELLHGDLMAQIGAIWTGERRLRELCEDHGVATVVDCAHEAIEYAARRTADAIRQIPDGRHAGTSWLDSDARDAHDVEIRCEVAVEGDMVRVSFAGSAPQVPTAMNASFAVLQAAGSAPVLLALGADLPHNDGCLRHIEVTAPEGTICNATWPAATTTATVHPGDVMQDAAFRALASALPDAVPAGGARWANTPMLSGVEPGSGRSWGHLMLMGGGGGGATAQTDGWPLITSNSAQGGLKCESVEEVELLYPIAVEEWEIEPGSMGLGAHIGGPGVRCSVRVREGEMQAIGKNDGLRNPPFGAHGGTPGGGGGAYVTAADGTRRLLDATYDVTLQAGERWTGVSTGGGGFGDPLERAPETVAADVRDGLYTRAQARDVCGVVLGEGRAAEPDLDATAALRAQLRDRRSAGPATVAPLAPHASTWQEAGA